MTKDKLTQLVPFMFLFIFMPCKGQSVNSDLLIYGYAHSPKKNHVSVSTMLNFTYIAKSYDSQRELVDNIEVFEFERYLAILNTYTAFEYSIFDGFSIGCEIPLYIYQKEIFKQRYNSANNSGKLSGSTGLGDIRIFINPIMRKDDKIQSKFSIFYKFKSGTSEIPVISDDSDKSILAKGTGVNDFGMQFSTDILVTRFFMFSLYGSRVFRQSGKAPEVSSGIDLGDMSIVTARFTYNILSSLYTGVELAYSDIDKDRIIRFRDVQDSKREQGYISLFLGTKIASDFHSLLVFNFHVHGRNVFQANVISLGIFKEF